MSALEIEHAADRHRDVAATRHNNVLLSDQQLPALHRIKSGLSGGNTIEQEECVAISTSEHAGRTTHAT